MSNETKEAVSSDFWDWASKQLPHLVILAAGDIETSDSAYDAKTQLDAMHYGWDAAIAASQSALAAAQVWARLWKMSAKDNRVRLIGFAGRYNDLCEELGPIGSDALAAAKTRQDEEISRWQKEIYNLLVRLTGDDSIDGSGTDSDELDFTLGEIEQAIGIIKDRQAGEK